MAAARFNSKPYAAASTQDRCASTWERQERGERFQSIIDDLTIENKRLKRRLNRCMKLNERHKAPMIRNCSRLESTAWKWQRRVSSRRYCTVLCFVRGLPYGRSLSLGRWVANAFDQTLVTTTGYRRRPPHKLLTPPTVVLIEA